jgi:hypothetical protein
MIGFGEELIGYRDDRPSEGDTGEFWMASDHYIWRDDPVADRCMQEIG